MKKGLKRIVVIVGILLVVTLIGLGIYWLVTQNSAPALASSGLEGGRHGGDFDGLRPGRDFADLDRRDRISSGFAWLSVGRILLEIGVVTLGVLLIQWMIRKLRKPKLAAAAPVSAVPPMDKPVESDVSGAMISGASEIEPAESFQAASQQPENSE